MQLQDISIRTASLATLKPVSATIAEEIPSRFVSPARWLWVPSDTLDGKVPGIYGCSSPQNMVEVLMHGHKKGRVQTSGPGKPYMYHPVSSYLLLYIYIHFSPKPSHFWILELLLWEICRKPETLLFPGKRPIFLHGSFLKLGIPNTMGFNTKMI